MAKRIGSLMAVDMSVNSCKRQSKMQRRKNQRDINRLSTGMMGISGGAVSPDTHKKLPKQRHKHKPRENGKGKQAGMSLPGNIQEEIAIVRGRKFGELSPSLKRLENSILGIDENDRHQAKELASQVVSSQSSLTGDSYVTSKSYDSGQEIRFENGWQRQPVVSQQVSRIVNTQSSSAPWGGRVFESLSSAVPGNTQHNYDTYDVEKFEPEDVDSIQVSRQLSKQKSHVDTVSSKQEAEKEIEDEYEEIGQTKQGLRDQEQQQQQPEPVEDCPVDEQQIGPIKSIDSQPAKKPSVVPSAEDKKSVELALKELEQDLEAVMGKKPGPDTRSQTISESQNISQGDYPGDDEVAESSQVKSEQAGDPHAIFEQMSMGMPYANTFNLGSMDLSKTFEQFDREIDAQEALNKPGQQYLQKDVSNKKPQQVSEQIPGSFIDPEAPDSMDVLADLADITQTQLANKQLASQEIIKKQQQELEKYRNAEAGEQEQTANVKTSAEPGNIAKEKDTQTKPAQTVEQKTPVQLSKDSQQDVSQQETHQEQQLELPQDQEHGQQQAQQQDQQQDQQQKKQQSTVIDTSQEQKPSSNDASSAIQYDVPLLNAIEDMSPAATAAAMLVAWHHKETPSMSDISNGEGIWKDYILSLNIKGPDVIEAWGLTKLDQALSEKNLKGILKDAGPLLVMQEDTVKLITGIRTGDPEPVISIIEVNQDGVSSAKEINQSDMTNAPGQRQVAHI